MGRLYLNRTESDNLENTIRYLEEKMSTTEYAFEPVDMMTGCTCEGNCDGVPSGCTWH